MVKFFCNKVQKDILGGNNMANIKKRYNRALSIAEFIVEGHTLKQTAEEFRVSDTTVKRDLEFLISQGNREEYDRNFKLYIKAKVQLRRNSKNAVKK